MKSAWILLIVSLAAQASSATTVAVGNCRPGLTSYSTISLAVAAVPSPTTVLVCPGTYAEQVTIDTPLTLKGLSLGTGSNPVITVPSGGIVGNDAQILVQGSDESAFGPVNISGLVVDGTGSLVNCSGATLTGIEYVFSSGTIQNVQVRNQNPGGCGIGIELQGSDFVVDTVNLLYSSIDNFDDTGVLATSSGATGFVVNLTANSIASTSTTVQAGVDYDFTDGFAARNNILVSAGTGLVLDNFFAGMTAKGNTIIGASVGIFSGLSEGTPPTTITENTLYNNGTGISISGIGGSPMIKANNISQSSVAAIDLNCAAEATAEKNTIFSAPLGIENVASGAAVSGNTFYSVPTQTTTCP